MRNRIMIVAAFVLSAAAVYAAPLGSEFTFQGQLGDSGQTASGNYEFEFELFDAASGGNSASIVISRTLDVEDGYFNTLLDFGDLPFLGDERWLQIRVRAVGDPGFQTLMPRQTITATPYALHAQFVAAAAVGSDEIDASQVQRRVSSVCSAGTSIRQINQDGSVVCELDNVSNSPWVEQGDGSILANTNAKIEPASTGRIALEVSQDSSISSPQIRLVESGSNDFSRMTFSNSDQVDSFWTIAATNTDNDENDRLNIYHSTANGGAGTDIFSVRGNRRVGINTTSPQAPLHVFGRDNWRPGSGDGYGDFHIGTSSLGLSMGVALGGGGAGTTRVWTQNDKPIFFVNKDETDTLMSLDMDNGRVGIGTGSPATRLHVAGGAVRIDDLAHAGPTHVALAVEPDGDLVLANNADQFLTLNHFAFFPTDSTVGYESFASVRFITDSSSNRLYAPITLPDGKQMEEMTVHFRDESSAHDLGVSLVAFTLGANSGLILADATSSGSTSGFRSITVPISSSIQATIDNATYAYSVNVSATPDWPFINGFGIQAVVIRYE